MLTTRIFSFIRMVGIILMASVSLSLVGCDSMLDLQPKDTLSQATFWETEKDLTTATNAIYQSMRGRFNPYNIFAMRDAYTPIGNARSGATRSIQRGTYTTTNNRVQAWWATSYMGIVRANDVLTHVDEMKIDEALKKKRKGEALFLRAWFYFNLAYLFGDVPLITGVPTLEDVTSIRRAPKEKVVAQMLADLDKAIKLLPSSWSDDKGRATKGGALTMKAKILMQEHRYQDAIPVLNQIMEMDYELFPSYAGLFEAGNEHHSGVIWTLQHTSGLGHGQGATFNHLFSPKSLGGGTGGWSHLQPTLALVKTYEKVGPDGPDPSGIPSPDPDCQILAVDCSLFVNKDPRMYYTILYPGSVYKDLDGETADYPERMGSRYSNTQTGLSIRKYIWTGAFVFDNWDAPQDWIFFRYADVLLLYAEAKIELGQIDVSVYKAINKVRGRVNMPPIEPPKTQQELREILRRERTVELALEGWNYFDMKRWGTLPEAMSGHEIVNVSNGIVQYTTQFVTPKHLLWPIPQVEMDRNPNLTQNPDW